MPNREHNPASFIWVEAQVEVWLDKKISPPLRLRSFTYYPRLRRVRSYVEANYRRPVHLADAAEVACLEPTYFSRYFKRRVGLGFCRWLALFRVGKALQALQQEERSITELAERVGVQDVRTLQRMMKRFTGFSPAELRACIQHPLKRGVG